MTTKKPIDIALIDDDGVTAVFAHNTRAKDVATGIVRSGCHMECLLRIYAWRR
jgi:hypothetical protein